jgi:ketosteroid isomerase-like protein
LSSPPAPETAELIERAYAAFNRRDIDGALASMTPDVEWANGWEGGHVHGHDAVRAYWTRQWAEIDPIVTPQSLGLEDDGRVSVTVDQQVRNASGVLVRAGLVRHVYTLRDGLVRRMDIEPAEG